MADAKITALTENTTPATGDLLAIVDDPAGTPSTQKIDINNLGILTGWVTAGETWTYATASTFTVSGDVTAKYSKGTRLKWTQTTVKYGVVVASSYSDPNTTVTIMINTDYTIANAAISVNYYSYTSNPQGYPGFFALAAPTISTTYFDNGAGGAATTTEHRASINGTTLIEHWRGNGTKAGTDPYFVFSNTLPLPANTTTVSSLGGFYAGDLYQGNYCRSTNPYIGITSINVPDNTVLGNVSFTATWEI